MTAEETIASLEAQLKQTLEQLNEVRCVQLSEQEKQPVREHLEQQFRIIFERLNVVNTQEALTPYV